ncbi:MAG: CcmD family protein [Aureispira sp.]
MMKVICNLAALLLLPVLVQAQDQGGNDFFSNIGKMYVTVAVIVILFLGIIAFLVYLERKVARLERDLEE